MHLQRINKKPDGDLSKVVGGNNPTVINGWIVTEYYNHTDSEYYEHVEKDGREKWYKLVEDYDDD